MKIDNDIRSKIALHIETEHQKALKDIMHNRQEAFYIPIHTAKMKMKQYGTGDDVIVPTIIPPMHIYYDPSLISTSKDGTAYINKGGIGYRIAYGGEPIPLAHVYNSSGYLCLGNIFVPSQIPLHCPMQPLETLFLHNDRVLSHGNPKLPLTPKQKREVHDILTTEFPRTHLPFNVQTSNWLRTDMLWVIGAYLLDNLSVVDAYKIMDAIFKIVFSSTKED